MLKICFALFFSCFRRTSRENGSLITNKFTCLLAIAGKIFSFAKITVFLHGAGWEREANLLAQSKVVCVFIRRVNEMAHFLGPMKSYSVTAIPRRGIHDFAKKNSTVTWSVYKTSLVHKYSLWVGRNLYIASELNLYSLWGQSGEAAKT